MSKQKTEANETEEIEVTGNLDEQSELDGITVAEEPVIVESPKSTPKTLDPRINTVATASVKGNKKMGVYKFLSLYPQDIYISTLLIFYYPHSFFTKDEWFQRIEDILNTPINN
ncbi:MAG: hypothetical protein K6E97_03580 [Treponema sp.]|nr:hypothetical protein [Treponema sp.]